MIQKLLKQIEINQNLFPLVDGVFESRFALVTKFCQRIATPQTKILFLVVYKNRPICIVKTVRDEKYNAKLINEIRKHASLSVSGILNIPKVYHTCSIDGMFFSFEEVVWGSIATKGIMKELEPKIIQSISNFGSNTEISFDIIFDALSTVLSPSNPNLILLKSYFGQGIKLKLGFTHNDFARQNIVVNKGKMYLVDWERSGECPLWLIDAVYLLVRSRKIKSFEDWKKSGLHDFVKYTGIDKDHAEILYCVLAELNKIRREDRDKYFTLVNKIFKQ